MNKILINLQKNCNNAVVILNSEYEDLHKRVSINASMSDSALQLSNYASPVFKEKLEQISKNSDTCYLVIKNIDQVSVSMQLRFLGLIKDREICGYSLPRNVIVVLTVSDKQNLKNIDSTLYHLCVDAI